MKQDLSRMKVRIAASNRSNNNASNISNIMRTNQPNHNNLKGIMSARGLGTDSAMMIQKYQPTPV